MCGIAGAWVLDESGRSVLERLPDAVKALARRGPDDEGLFFHGRCGLGHRRLSILDTSPAAHQPMTDPEERFTLVFNGEIFNFKSNDGNKSLPRLKIGKSPSVTGFCFCFTIKRIPGGIKASGKTTGTRLRASIKAR